MFLEPNWINICRCKNIWNKKGVQKNETHTQSAFSVSLKVYETRLIKQKVFLMLCHLITREPFDFDQIYIGDSWSSTPPGLRSLKEHKSPFTNLKYSQW